MKIVVRPATAADAARLSQLGAATFCETFEGENTPEDMARYLAETFTPEKQAEEISDPASTILLAERENTSGADLVGYVHLVAGTAPPQCRDQFRWK
jgi:diamine N-acetyltransferase